MGGCLHGPLHITDPAPAAPPRSFQRSRQQEGGQSRNSPCVLPHPLTPPPAVAHEHLKERGLCGLPPPPPGAGPADFYHLMASHRSPYGDLLMQGGGASAGAHLSDYITPIDGE